MTQRNFKVLINFKTDSKTFFLLDELESLMAFQSHQIKGNEMIYQEMQKYEITLNTKKCG